MEELQQKVEEWAEWDKNESTRIVIASLWKSKDTDKLAKLLLFRIQFGTAGLRGVMGAGYSQMNDLVIIQTTQGLYSYLKELEGKSCSNGVVIGYDGRHNSRRFAELTSSVFLNGGVTVYLFSQVCPTPFVPFAVTHYKCVAGIMITASHNPKDDNGYKVYWKNGAQIISPHDKNIQNHILKNLKPWEKSWDTSILNNCSLLKDPLNEIMKHYFSSLGKTVLYRDINASTPLIFTYTAMHGVGYPYIKKAMEAANFKPFIAVQEQKDPDPDFPTVKFPNPEEGKSALDLAMKTANENGSTVILANDPDADRLAVAEKNFVGDWQVFSGNELGALLGWWSFYSYKQSNPNADLSKVYMLASTVSSKVLKSIGSKEGFQFMETLTGFKWMGNKTYELIGENKVVLFAYEEAIGFMCGTDVLDKDGVSAAVHAAELAAYLRSINMTLAQKLKEIYCKYGHHISDNSYYICHEAAVIKSIFQRLRNFSGVPNTYPQSILSGKYSICSIRDLTTGFDNTQPDNKAVLPISKSSEMITFTFTNGLVATLRTSGTEPKIKYYTELCASPEEQDLDVLRTTLQEMVTAIVQEFLQPEINALIPRTE